MGANGDMMRSKILKVFNDLLYEKGYKDTTLRDIADRVGISRGHLYFYYKKKEDLVNELSLDFYAKFNLIMKDEIPDQLNPLVKFFITKYFGYYLYLVMPELKRLQMEYSLSTTIVDELIKPDFEILKKALKKCGYKKDEQAVLSSVSSANAGYYALKRLEARNQISFGIRESIIQYIKVVLGLLDIDYTEILTNTLVEFEKLNKDNIVKRVYEMDQYDYLLEE